MIFNNKMAIVYALRFPSGKMYIGQTRSTLDKRFREHVYDTMDLKKNHCKLLNHAIRKYGIENVIKQVLIETDLENVNAYEEYFIQLYRTMSPNGYNLKAGGSASSHTDEVKAKISYSMTGLVRSREDLEKRSLSRKSDKTLPMYIIPYYNRVNKELQGYRVTHPMFKERRFSLNTCLEANTMDQVRKIAIDYLTQLNHMDKVQRLNGDG